MPSSVDLFPVNENVFEPDSRGGLHQLCHLGERDKINKPMSFECEKGVLPHFSPSCNDYCRDTSFSRALTLVRIHRFILSA